MKRSEINAVIDRAIAFFRAHQYPLPPFAFWTPEEWRARGPELDELRRTRIGWDVTDFGSGDFARIGRTIFTLRNGSARYADQYPKRYAQKVMFLQEGQKSPIHFHRSKMEDIINNGGGSLTITLWKADAKDRLTQEPLVATVDGCARAIAGGTTLALAPGESVCVPPRTYHEFCAGKGGGPVLSMEVSSVCDDLADNFWLEPRERFPSIAEDEPSRHCLCGEYPPAAAK